MTAFYSLARARTDRLVSADQESGGHLSDLHGHAWAINERAATPDEARLAGYPGEALRVLTVFDETHTSAGFARYIVRWPQECAGPFDYLRRIEILGNAPNDASSAGVVGANHADT